MDKWRLTAIAAVIALSLCVVGGLALIATGNVSAETDEPGPVYGSGESPYGGMSVSYDDLEDGAMYHIVRYGLVHISFAGTGATGMETDLAGSGLVVDYGNESIDGELIHSCIVTIGDKTITLVIVVGMFENLPIYGDVLDPDTITQTYVTDRNPDPAYYKDQYLCTFLVVGDFNKNKGTWTVKTDLRQTGLEAELSVEDVEDGLLSGHYEIYCTISGGSVDTKNDLPIEIEYYEKAPSSAYSSYLYTYTTTLDVVSDYTVIFDYAGGNVNGHGSDTVYVPYEASTKLPSPTLDSNTYCEGWYTDKSGGGLRVGGPDNDFNPSTIASMEIKTPITLYANWVETTNPVVDLKIYPSGNVTVAVGSQTTVSVEPILQNENGYVTDDAYYVDFDVISGENYITWSVTNIEGVGGECKITGVSQGTAVIKVTPRHGTSEMSRTITVNVSGAGTVTMYDYTIKYHYNDGIRTYWTDSLSSQYNPVTNYILSSRIPDRDGYTFLGWARSDTATEPDFRRENLTITGVSLTQSNNGVNDFYAVWDKIDVTWSLKFDADGITADPSDMTALVTGNYHDFKPLPTLADVEDNVFLGWAKTPSATVPVYAGGGQYRAWTDGETLYAVWGTKVTTNNFILEYDTHGGTSIAPLEFRNKTESEWPTNVSNTRPTKAGYTFLGWAHSVGDAATIEPGADIILNPGTKTLHAVWSQDDYVLILYGNGGSPERLEIPTQEDSIILSDAHVPTRDDGYSFLGWSDTPEGSAYKFVGSSIDFDPENSEVELYAVWMPSPEVGDRIYTLYLDPRIEGMDIISLTFKESEIPFEIPDLELENPGFEFAGWTDREDSTYVYWMHGVVGKDTYTPESDYKTIYAVWTVKSDTWVVKLNLNGGYGGPGDIHVPDVPDNTSSLNVPIPGPEPKKHGFLFMGWGISSDDKDPIRAGGNYVATGKTSELIAVWDVDPNQWVLHLDANGGKDAPVIDGAYPIDGECDFRIPLKRPTLEGHNFLGWWTEKTEIGEITDTKDLIQPGSTHTSKTKDETLYAVWSDGIPGRATLVFNLMEGTYSGTGLTLDPVECTEFHEFDVPDVTPTKGGYTFLGWADKPNSKKADYTFENGSKIKVDSGKTKMVYAVWTAEGGNADDGSDDDGGWGLGTYIAIVVIAILALFIILRFAGVV